ncbi:hypothetical protein ACFXHD_02560 [Streptomyces hydrogenans]|uniref:hypothetical protein n=1 Tax=Streptomyces hydrogenans TaxID=1873719 RepID=UPI003696FBB1
MADTVNLADVATLADLKALLERLGLEELWNYALLTKEASLLGGPEALRLFHQKVGAQAREAALHRAQEEIVRLTASAGRFRANPVGVSIVSVTVSGALFFALGKWSARRAAAQAAKEAPAPEQIEQAHESQQPPPVPCVTDLPDNFARRAGAPGTLSS